MQLPPRNQWRWMQAHQTARGDGTTSKQMRDAPLNSIYIVANPRELNYHKRLAQQLLRKDLIFKTRNYIGDQLLRGWVLYGIAVDHSIQLTYLEMIELCQLKITPPQPQSLVPYIHNARTVPYRVRSVGTDTNLD